MTHADAVTTLATERYLLDEMTERERDAFEAHYFECAECADDVTAASQMREGVKHGLVERRKVIRPTFALAQERPPLVVKTPWYRSAALPWAVAATLAVAVGYQSTPDRGPREAPATGAALTPTVLRPASRGAIPVVSGAGGHVALALDVDVTGSAAVRYALLTDDGRTLLAGTSAAPAVGSPLLLVLPTFTLTPERTYTLSVRDAAQPDRALGDYTFTMGSAR